MKMSQLLSKCYILRQLCFDSEKLYKELLAVDEKSLIYKEITNLEIIENTTYGRKVFFENIRNITEINVRKGRNSSSLEKM